VGLEAATYISGLVATNPVVGDDVAQGDDHLRLIKSTLLATFPNVTGAVTPTHTQLGYVTGVTSAIQTQLDLKAALASPTLTGTPAAPTAAVGTNTTQIATTAFVTQGVSGEWVLMQSQTLSAVAQCDFVNGTGGVVISTAYDAYRIEILDLLPASSGVFLQMRTSTNAGSSYDSGASDYVWHTSARATNSSTDVISFDVGDPQISLMAGTGVGTTASDGINGQVDAWKLTGAAAQKFRSSLLYGNGGVYYAQTAIGVRATAADVDAIRLFFSSSVNITSGIIKFYGRRV
jgi:hypothetical protein